MFIKPVLSILFITATTNVVYATMGDPVNISNAPYVVALDRADAVQISRQAECTGAVVHEHWLITLDHCLIKKESTSSPGNFVILYQSNQLRSPDTHAQPIDYAVSYRYGQLDLNKRHEGSLFMSDGLVLVRVAVPFPPENIISVLDYAVPNGTELDIYGYGNRLGPNTMLTKTSARLSNDTRLTFTYDLTFGDSGGPAIYNNSLVGLFKGLLLGRGIIRPTYKYKSWITQTISDYENNNSVHHSPIVLHTYRNNQSYRNHRLNSLGFNNVFSQYEDGTYLMVVMKSLEQDVILQKKITIIGGQPTESIFLTSCVSDSDQYKVAIGGTLPAVDLIDETHFLPAPSVGSVHIQCEANSGTWNNGVCEYYDTSEDYINDNMVNIPTSDQLVSPNEPVLEIEFPDEIFDGQLPRPEGRSL